MSASDGRWRGWQHPLVLASGLVVALRIAAISWFYFTPGVVNGPLNFIPVAAAYHALCLLGLLAGVLGLAALTRSSAWRRGVTRVGLTLFAVALLAGAAEFLLLRHTGHKLTPAVLRTYGGVGVWTKEVLAPLTQDGRTTAVILGLVGLGWAALTWLALRRTARETAVILPGGRILILLAGVMAGLAVVVVRDRPMQRAFVQPPEWTFITAFGNSRTAAPPDEAAARATLRALVPLAPGWQWRDDLHPLQRVAVPGGVAMAESRARQADLPDIILIAVESLRAQDLWFAPFSPVAETPNLRRLAAQGVLFPQFISNGFPSVEGFFSLHTGHWPHPARAATVDSTGLRLSALPTRLGAAGYHRLALWGGNASFDHQLPWAKIWYDELVYQTRPGELIYSQPFSDAALVDEVIGRGRVHDRERAGQPWFVFVATGGTHGPFLSDDKHYATVEQRAEAEALNPAGDFSPAERYRRALRLFDRQLGRLLDWLEQRPRARNTVIMVCGDHSIAVEPRGSPLARALPTDDFVWTGAIIAGPERLIGASPQVAAFPASQVDVLPTVLAMIGDTGPQAGPGADLLAEIPTAQRVAVAIRPGGWRLDRQGQTLLVPAAEWTAAWREPSFARRQWDRPGNAAADNEGAATLQQAVRYWSYLLEENRLWPAER